MKILLKKTVSCATVIIWVLLLGISNAMVAGDLNKGLSIQYTLEEKKAIRIEMIEMDITLRTMTSMISLNKPDRLEILFKKLSELQLVNSTYHKAGISGAEKKWKKHELTGYLDKIQKESKNITKYLHEINTAEKKQEVKWDIIYQANRKILENCQGCHKVVGVDIE